MANSISEVSDILIAGAQPVLREMATTARRVTTEWRDEAATRNQRIDIPISSPKSVNDITDPLSPPAVSDVEPFVVPVVLDKWKTSGFQLNDKEQMELMPGIFPGEAEEALRALVNAVDVDILGTALESPYYAIQTAALAWADIPALHKVLFDNKVPMTPGDISVFVDGKTQAALLGLQEFIHADKTGETGALRTASLAMRLGMEFFANQNVGTHAQGALPATFTINGDQAATSDDEQTVAHNGASSPTVGDIYVFEYDDGTYGLHTIVANPTASTTTIRPALPKDVDDTDSIIFPNGTAGGFPTFAAAQAYTNNYAFHRRAIAFASRPLSTIETPGTTIRTVSDPLSGISLRLEIKRVGKVNRFEWDILYGVKLVRPELTCRWVDKA
jgi:hypothetical protein